MRNTSNLREDPLIHAKQNPPEMKKCFPKKTQPKENKSVLKQIESLLNNSEASLQHNKLSVSSTKVANQH